MGFDGGSRSAGECVGLAGLLTDASSSTLAYLPSLTSVHEETHGHLPKGKKQGTAAKLTKSHLSIMLIHYCHALAKFQNDGVTEQ